MAKRTQKKMKKTRLRLRTTPRSKRKKSVKRKVKSAKKMKSKKKMKKSKRTVVKGKKMKMTKKKTPSKKQTTAVAKAAKKAKQKLIGKVIHYYDKIGVAIVDLQSPLKLGQTVMMKRGDLEWTQPVDSIQIEHLPVPQAKKGDVVGMKVGTEVREGTLVMPV